MLTGRLYRAAFLPFRVRARDRRAFSLTGRPAPLHSTLAPDAFEGAPAFAELTSLRLNSPTRRPGSRGDQGARHACGPRASKASAAAAAGGFTVRSTASAARRSTATAD